MIIDCHVHMAPRLTGFWEPLRYGKVRDRGQVTQQFPPSFDPPASPPEVLLGHMDQVGVDRALIVQHHMYGDHNVAVLDAIKRWPDRFVGFAYLGSLDQPEAPDQLEHLVEAGMTGLKIELQSTRRLRPGFCFDGDREWRVFERLNQLRRPLMLDLNEGTVEDVKALHLVLDACENVRFVSCHVGWPATEGWQERALLAKHPRGWVDLAWLPSMFGPEQEYPFGLAQGFACWAVGTFGAGRVMWGTDYPGCLNQSTYRQQLDWVRRHCPFLSEEDRRQVLGGAAEAFLAGLGL